MFQLLSIFRHFSLLSWPKIKSHTRPATPSTKTIHRRPNPFSWFFILAAIFYTLFALGFFSAPTPKSVPLSYTSFIGQVQKNNVKSVSVAASSLSGTFSHPYPYHHHSYTTFTTQIPSFAGGQLESLLQSHHVNVNAVAVNNSPSLLTSIFFTYGPVLLFVLLFFYIMRSMGGGGSNGNGLFGIGTSKARLYNQEKPDITFADVAGIEDAKQELEEIVDFLRNPTRYQRLGGNMPKGVLLIGPPGTGKTLLARAVAGEAHVPFFNLSASEFIEMIVGVGASRVRDLFKKARAAAPAIIFIDELDAIGRSRSAGATFGGHDEREQTLNQILTEMDGFDPREGVIVLAATNRADVLDAALLRPGRFDRRVQVHPPDRKGRAAILAIHTRGVPLAPDVSLDNLASNTPGLVGAELRNLVNEAALLAAKHDQNTVGSHDFAAALEKVLLGAERQIVLSPEDRRRTAYHESGHALLGLLLPESDPVRRVSIIPRGGALGVTYQSPVDDRQNYTETYLRSRITGALGGRAAEKLVFSTATTGAENDLRVATQIARQMISHWGMSDKVGLQNLEEDPQQSSASLLSRPYSEQTAQLVDDEIRHLLDTCYAEALRLLTAERPRLDALANALLQTETLTEQEIWQVTKLSPPSST